MSENADKHFTITFMSGPLDGKVTTWTLPDSEELVLTIGRRPGCDIVLDYDTQVSRLHARLIYDPGTHSFYLEDMGSRNGTLINQTRLKGRAPLQPGVLFRIGRTWLRLDAPKSVSTDAPGSDDHLGRS